MTGTSKIPPEDPRSVPGLWLDRRPDIRPSENLPTPDKVTEDLRRLTEEFDAQMATPGKVRDVSEREQEMVSLKQMLEEKNTQGLQGYCLGQANLNAAILTSIMGDEKLKDEYRVKAQEWLDRAAALELTPK